jgi:hypothetical protein
VGFLRYPAPDSSTDAVTKAGNGTGIGLRSTSLRAKLEYRILEEGFVPSLFGYGYEYQARTPGQGIFLDPRNNATRGYYGNVAWKLMQGAALAAVFEDYNGTGPASDPRLGIRLDARDLIEQVSMQAYYIKRGIGGVDSKGEKQSFWKDLVDLDEKSRFILELGYNIKPPFQVLIIREYRFRERADGRGFEPIQKTTGQFGIRTRF